MLFTINQKLLLLSGTIILSIMAQTSEAQVVERTIEQRAEQVASQQLSFPAFSGDVITELQNEYTVHSDNSSTDGYNNMFLRSEVAPTLQFTNNFYIDGVGVFENIQNLDENKSNYFDNEGLFIEEIKLNYDNGPWSVFAGKFNPSFGIAWDFRGIWGEDFAEDYEITERLGLGGGYALETPDLGTHAISASTFFADTTFLSQSKITDRGELDKSDGGISNTESFESFAISLDGENIAGVEGLYYKLGYQNQAEGDVDIGADRQVGYAAALGHTMPVTSYVGVDGLIEFVDINNVDGANINNQYITTSLITTIDNTWNLTLSYTGRNIDTVGADIDDHLFQISGGYDFGQGTTAQIGYRSAEESGTDTNIIGGLVRHSFEF